MDREILFRGKDLETDKWLYGSFIKTSNHAYISTSGEAFPAKVKTETISQYIGLTDKNGTKVFEGDIVRIGRQFGKYLYGEDNYVCKYDANSATYKFYYIVPKDITNINGYAMIGNGVIISEMERGFTIEVIGNIFDNSELLQENG